ncbi:MAG: hypothetical protein EB075_00270 [Bacteroidetes bacterium]|nr:hypothetical protein [Bacteroidota bacterium]
MMTNRGTVLPYLLLIALVVTGAGCTGLRVTDSASIPDEAPRLAAFSQAALDDVFHVPDTLQTIAFEGGATIQMGRRSNTVSILAVSDRSGSLDMSVRATFGIEVFRVSISDDSVRVYDVLKSMVRRGSLADVASDTTMGWLASASAWSLFFGLEPGAAPWQSDTDSTVTWGEGLWLMKSWHPRSQRRLGGGLIQQEFGYASADGSAYPMLPRQMMLRVHEPATQVIIRYNRIRLNPSAPPSYYRVPSGIPSFPFDQERQG